MADKDYKVRRQVWQDKFDIRKHADMKWSVIVSDSFNAVIAYSLAAIKGCTLLNGGGAVALLSFTAASSKAACIDLSDTLLLFIFGALLAVLSAGVSYIGQTLFTFQSRANWALEICTEENEEHKILRHENNRKQRLWGSFGLICQFVGCFLLALSFICFWEGCHRTYGILKYAPATC